MRLLLGVTIGLGAMLSGCATVGQPSYCPAVRQNVSAQVVALHPYDLAWIGTILSQLGYEGNCPCPDSTDVNGNRCGARSAYSHGRNFACVPEDVPRSDLPRVRAILAEKATPIECGGGGLGRLLEWPPTEPQNIPEAWR